MCIRDRNVTVYEYDPAKGAALLDEAGWTLQEGADFRRVYRKGYYRHAIRYLTHAVHAHQQWNLSLIHI